MEQRRKKLILLAMISCLAIVVTAAVAWSVYFVQSRMPSGPELPPAAPEGTFSEEVIALNNKAVKIHLADADAAIQLYDRAIAIDPEYFKAYANKGRLLMQQGDFDDAEACFGRLTSLRPRVAEYYLGHAYCLMQQGETEAVEDRLLHALSAYNYQLGEPAPSTERVWPRLNRAIVLSLLGRDRLAEKEFEALDREYPHYSSMLTEVADRMKTSPRKERWEIILPGGSE